MMILNYGRFVANMFFPELAPAAEFYGNLSKEAQRVLPGCRRVDYANLPTRAPLPLRGQNQVS